MKSKVLFLKDLKSLPLPRDFFTIQVNFHCHSVPWEEVEHFVVQRKNCQEKLDDEIKDCMRIHLFFKTKHQAFEQEFSKRIFPEFKQSLTKYSSFYLDPVEYGTYRQNKLKQIREKIKKEEISYMDYLHSRFDPKGELFRYEMERELERTMLEEFKWKLYRDAFLKGKDLNQASYEESEETKEQRIRKIVRYYCHQKVQYVEKKKEDF